LNAYCYATNRPTILQDPSGFKPSFKYKLWGDVELGIGSEHGVGYRFGLDIFYPPTGVDGRPEKGSFVQVVTLRTVILYSKEGTIQAHYPPSFGNNGLKYMLDIEPLPGEYPGKYHDTLGGPAYEGRHAPNPILAFQDVYREHGFSLDILARKRGKTIRPDDAQKYIAAMSNKCAKGTYEYTYLFISSTNLKKQKVWKKLKISDLVDVIKDQTLNSKLTATIKAIKNSKFKQIGFPNADEEFLWDVQHKAFNLFRGTPP